MRELYSNLQLSPQTEALRVSAKQSYWVVDSACTENLAISDQEEVGFQFLLYRIRYALPAKAVGEWKCRSSLLIINYQEVNYPFLKSSPSAQF